MTTPSTNIRSIGLVANTSWYLWNFRSTLIKRLLNSGYRVTLFSPKDEYTERLIAIGANHCPIEFVGSSTSPLTEWRTLLSLWRAVQLHNPTVLLTYTPKGNIYGAFAIVGSTVKLICNISGLGTAGEAKGALQSMIRYLYRFVGRRASTVFFQNGDDLQSFVRNQLVPQEKAARLPGSGVDLERFAFTGPRINTKATSTPFTAIFIGRLLWKKGVGDFVNALKLLRQRGVTVQALVVGPLIEGGAAAVPAKILSEWVDAGIIEYLGASDDIRPLLREADCIVLPSTYLEGIPRVLLEASAIGIPSITYDWVGCREAVEDGVNGFLCPPGNIESLADAIERLSALSAEDRLAMSRRARTRAETMFDEEIVLKQYAEKIRLLCSGAPPGQVMQ
jgi:glycosyltransferase involved in cell wall biosynthesis